uniref:Uncharacterized protein n=1 Tax=Sipha flava TaxID=143950 RepID=A0A2S2QNU2_9HEMI
MAVAFAAVAPPLLSLSATRTHSAHKHTHTHTHTICLLHIARPQHRCSVRLHLHRATVMLQREDRYSLAFRVVAAARSVARTHALTHAHMCARFARITTVYVARPTSRITSVCPSVGHGFLMRE